MILTTICVGSVTEVEFIWISAPKLTWLKPLLKFEPVKVTLKVLPLDPITGAMLESVGAGFSTVRAFGNVAVPPPGAALVTETLLAPGTASNPMLIFAVI